MGTSVREIMTTNLVRMPGRTSLREAARAMRDSNIGDVIVENNGRFCGIVTDRDIVVRALADGRDGNANLDSICSKDVATLTATSTDEDAVSLMRERSVRRLPVMDDGKVVGIVTLRSGSNKRPNSVLGRISAAAPNA